MITQIPKKIYLFLNNRNLLDHAVDDVFPIIQLFQRREWVQRHAAAMRQNEMEWKLSSRIS